MKGFAVGFLNFLLALSIAALGLAFMINATILNPKFVVSELDKLNATSLINEQLTRLIPQQEAGFMKEAIDATFTDLEPWLKEQLKTSIYAAEDYITGKSKSLSLTISTEPLRESLKENLWEAIQKSPPPELAGLPPAQAEQLFNQLYEQQIANNIPPKFEVTERTLPPQIMGILTQVKQYVSYVQIAFKGLIALSIVLVLGIVLIRRQVRASTRALGVTFTVYGAIWYGGIFAAKQFLSPQIAQMGFNLPAGLQPMIPKLLDDLVSPLQMFTLGFLVAGVVLLIVSHVYKPRQAAE